MILRIIKCEDKPEKANKSFKFSLNLNENSKILIRNSSVKNPQFEIYGFNIDDMEEYNYAYIPKYSRYYFMEKEFLTNGKVLLTLHCDLLTTAYHLGLFSNDKYAILERSASDFNTYAQDDLVFRKLAYNTPYVYGVQGDFKLCDNDDTYYYIITTGGDW